jgi:arylsulfatase
MNILLIMADQHRYDALSCLGHPVVNTPVIDSLANDGHVFTNAYTPSAWCIPSRIALFRSLYPNRSGAIANSRNEFINEEDASWIQSLKTHGYQVGLVGKNHAFTDKCRGKFFDEWEEFDHSGYVDGEVQTSADLAYRRYIQEKRLQKSGLIDGPLPFRAEDCPTYRTAEEAAKFIYRSKNQPFFLFLSFADPHHPHIAPEPYYSMYPAQMFPPLEAADIKWEEQPFTHCFGAHCLSGLGSADYSIEERQRVLATYYGQINFVDSSLRMVIDALDAIGKRKDTAIIYMSDHGDLGGRYGFLEKGMLREVTNRIPLIIQLPGLPKRGHHHSLVQNMDLMPTIFEHLQLPLMRDIDGISFLSVINGEKAVHRRNVFSEGGYLLKARSDKISRENKRKFWNVVKGVKKRRKANLKVFHQWRRASEKQARHYNWAKNFLVRGDPQKCPQAVLQDDWKMYSTPGDKVGLFHLETDPYEAINLAYHEDFKEKRLELERILEEWSDSQAGIRDKQLIGQKMWRARYWVGRIRKFRNIFKKEDSPI